MNLEQRIDAFAKLGQFFKQFSNLKIEKMDDSELNTLFLMLLKCKSKELQSLMVGLQKTMF